LYNKNGKCGGLISGKLSTRMGGKFHRNIQAISDIQRGKRVCILDPHGEFAEKILDYIPRSRINDVLYFNPADLDYPIAFNLFEKIFQVPYKPIL